MREATEIAAYEIPLASVSSLKYLESVVLELDDDWMAVVRNLRRLQQKFLQLTRVLGR